LLPAMRLPNKLFMFEIWHQTKPWVAAFLPLFLSTILFFSRWMGPCGVRQKTYCSCLETLAYFAIFSHSSLLICIAFCVQLCTVSSGRSLFITYRPSQSSLSHLSYCFQDFF
jgi:hypothetical protein